MPWRPWASRKVSAHSTLDLAVRRTRSWRSPGLRRRARRARDGPPEVALKRRVDPGVAARYSNSCDDEVITYGEKSFSKREALRQALKSEDEVALLTVQRSGHGPTTSKFAPPVTNRNLMKEDMEAVNVMETSNTTRVMRASRAARKPAGRAARRRPALGARRLPAAVCRH